MAPGAKLWQELFGMSFEPVIANSKVGWGFWKADLAIKNGDFTIKHGDFMRFHY